MTTFALVTTIASIVTLCEFLAISIKNFGLLPSYSAYNPEWDKKVPINNMHLWSIVTFAIAALFMPALIELGQGNPWQFLGFFSPLYLIVVVLFPLTELPADASEYERKEWEKKRKIHAIGATLCALVTTLWIVLVCKLWWVALLALFIVSCAAFATKTAKTSTVLWLEMALFVGGYAAILIGG